MTNSLPILPTISTCFIMISAILVAFGWYFITKGKKEAHIRTMFAAALAALVFFIIYMTRTIFIGNTSFGGPENMKTFYTVFLIFHIFLATTGAIFGIVTLISGYTNRLKMHKKIGPVTSIIWFCSALTGVIVYLLLYVFYHGGETTSTIKAILGN